MPRLRRLTAVLVHVLMLHLLLVGGGDACVLPAVTAALRGVIAPGAAPPVAVASRADRDAHAAGGATAPTTMAGMQGRMHDDGPCDALPNDSSGERSRPGPASVCQTLAPCAPAALPATVALVPTRAAARVRVAVTAHVERAPAARVTPPEPPPPRA